MQAATKKIPNLSKLLEWGTPVWVKIKNAGDLDVRAKKVHFVGYDLWAKGMRLWPGTRKIMVERDVYFNEKDDLECVQIFLKPGSGFRNQDQRRNRCQSIH
jgi:hypothetical protein